MSTRRDRAMIAHRHLGAALLLVSSASMAACRSTVAPTTGTISLQIVTSGVDLDTDGYTVVVDGGNQDTLPVNGFVHVIRGEGMHSLEVSGLAFNCDLASAPTSPTVTLGDTARVTIRVNCSPYLRDAIVYTSSEFTIGGSGVAELMVMRADGSRRERLTTDLAGYADPAVSPDGQSIAVASFLGGSWHGIYLLDRFGKSRRLFVSRSNLDGSPAWSPNGSQLAFRSERSGPFGGYGRILLINRDGSGLRQLSPETEQYTFDSSPSWSPDGTQIVYSHSGELTLISVANSELTDLDIRGECPAWSPDGGHIAFTAYSGTVDAIFVADADGGSVRQLTTPAKQDQCPRWSPDGREIVFERFEDGFFQIYKMLADGTEITRLSASAASEFGASWSPLQ